MKIYINPQQYYTEKKEIILNHHHNNKNFKVVKYNDTLRRLKLYIFSIYVLILITLLSIFFSIINNNINILVNIGIFFIFVIFTYISYKLSFYINVSNKDIIYNKIIRKNAMILIISFYMSTFIIMYLLWKNILIIILLTFLMIGTCVIVIFIIGKVNSTKWQESRRYK